MRKLFIVLTALCAMFATAAQATDFGSGQRLAAGLNGSLTLGNIAQAGSTGATGAGVAGSVKTDVRGTTTASSWATGRTHFRSASGVNGCGYCGNSAWTNTDSVSDARGGAAVRVGPRIDPAKAEYQAYGESAGGSYALKGMELNLDGYVKYREYDEYSSKPGNGYGDDNHDHSGPPGQDS